MDIYIVKLMITALSLIIQLLDSVSKPPTITRCGDCVYYNSLMFRVRLEYDLEVYRLSMLRSDWEITHTYSAWFVIIVIDVFPLDMAQGMF